MASTYLNRTQATATDRKKVTLSTWVKRSNLTANYQFFVSSYISATDRIGFYFNSDESLSVFASTAGTTLSLQTSALYRDVSAWYHVVVAIDTTQVTSSNRVKMYVNGEQITSFQTATYPTINSDLQLGTASYNMYVGNYDATQYYFDGLMADVYLIDGLAYDASTFGFFDSTTGIWKPNIAPTVTYGANGFNLKFTNGADAGEDFSGNNNDFATNGTPTQTLDCPSNVFATMNPLVYNPNQANYNPLFSNGNTTTSSNTSVNAFSNARATLAVTRGKWYAEFKITSSDANMAIGLINYTSGVRSANNWGLTYQNDGAVSFNPNGSITINNVTSGTSFSGYASGDILQLAFDRTSEKIWLGKNGTWFNSGNPSSGTNELLDLSSTIGNDEFWTFAVGFYHSVSEVWNANFGNGFFGTTAVVSAGTNAGIGTFEYDVPAGYYALCTKNINTQEYS